MDIEKLIEQLNARGLSNGSSLGYHSGLFDDAAALSTLQGENEKMRAELERVKEERDAVVESIPHECKTCVYHTVFFNGCTLDHDCTNPDGGCSYNYDRWRWRGPQKEDWQWQNYQTLTNGRESWGRKAHSMR